MEKGSFKVKTTNYTFVMNVSHYDTIYSIKYGDALNRQEGPCIDLTYDTEDNFIKLDCLHYDPRCSYNTILEKGTGTREMIMSLLKLCVESFPNIKRILLHDASTILCKNENLELSYYYLVIHGQTWYEKYFHAKPVRQKMNQKLKTFKTFLQEKPVNNIFSFYSQSSTDYNSWHDYFRRKPCSFFIKHKEEIEQISKIKLLYSEWFISSKYALEYEVNIKSIKKCKHKQVGGYSSKNQLFSIEDL